MNFFLLMGGQSKQSGTVPAPAFTFNLTGPSLPSGVALTRSSIGTYVNVSGVLVAAPVNQPRFEFSGATGIVIQPPIATGDAYVTTQSTALTVAAPGILTNDRDPQGQAIIVNAFDATSAHGVIACNNNGSFTYTPTTGYSGADSWTYNIKNTSGVVSTSRATVAMTVNAVVSGQMTLAWASPAAGATVTGPVTFNFTGTNLASIVVSGPHGALTQTNGATTATIVGNTASFTYNSALDADGTESYSAVGTNPAGTASSGTRSFVLANNSTLGTPTTGPTFDQGLSISTPAVGPAPIFLPTGGKGAGIWTPVLNLTYGTNGTGTTNGLAHMFGIKMGNSTTNQTAVAGWLGRQLDILGTTITTTGFIGGTGGTYIPANSVIDLSFPMISIFGENPAIHDMAQAATGGYDATYTAMAKAAAALGNPIATFSPGWEQSGQWYGWSVGVGSPYQGALNPSTANYIAAYRRISIIMKQFNPKALSQFCFAIGRDPSAYWPGTYDPVTNPGGVDVISCDFYQSNVKTDTGSNLFSAAQSGYTAPASTALRNFYVSAAGNNANNGTSQATPWATMAKVNAHTTIAGDCIHFRCGDTWSGTTLTITAAGTSANPVQFTSYGTGANPIIDLGGAGNCVTTNGASYINFDHFTLNGAGGTASFVMIGGSSHIAVSYCSMTNGSGGFNVPGTGCSYVSVDHCLFDTLSTEAIWGWDVDHYIATNNTVQNLSGTFTDCMQIEVTNDYYVANNIFNQTGDTSSTKGCFISQNNNLNRPSGNCVFENNICIGGNFAWAVGDNNAICRNNLFQNQGRASGLDWPAGIDIADTVGSASYPSGPSLGLNNVTATGNLIQNCVNGVAIWTSGHFTNIKVNSNWVQGCSTAYNTLGGDWFPMTNTEGNVIGPDFVQTAIESTSPTIPHLTGVIGPSQAQTAVLSSAANLDGMVKFAQQQSGPAQIIWGINGHNDTGAGQYGTTTMAQKITAIQAIFGKTLNSVPYRGVPAGYANFTSDCAALFAAGLIPQVMIGAFPGFPYANAAAAFSAGQTDATNAVNGSPAVQLYEIGNEWDIWGNGAAGTTSFHNNDGSHASDWNTQPLFTQMVGYIAGAVTAIRSLSPNAKIISGCYAGWTFFGLPVSLFAALSNYNSTGVDLRPDYVVVHWYQDVVGGSNGGTDLANFNNGMNLYTSLKVCGRPIFVTEWGSATDVAHEAQAGTVLVALMNNFNAHSKTTLTEPGIAGTNFYQLYNADTNSYAYEADGSISGEGTAIQNWLATNHNPTPTGATQVKVGLREWGAGPGGGSGSGTGANDGTYVAACLNWIAGLPAGLFLFNLYADDPPADDIIAAGVDPAEQAAFKAVYAGTHFSGTWWTGPATPTQGGSSLANPTITSLAPLGNYVVACNNCGGPPTPNLYGTYGALSTVPASWNQLDKSIFVPGGNQTMRQNGFLNGEPFSIGPNYLRVTMTATTSPNVGNLQVNTGRFSPALFINPRISGIDFLGETSVRMTAQAGQPFPFIWYAWWFTGQGYDFEIDTVETFGFNNASPKTAVNQNSPCELAHSDAPGSSVGSLVTQNLTFTTSGGSWTLNFDFRQWVTMQMAIYANGTWACYWSGTLSDGTTVTNKQVSGGSYTSSNPIGLQHDNGWFGPSANSRPPSGTEPSNRFPFFYDYQYLRYWFR